MEPRTRPLGAAEGEEAAADPELDAIAAAAAAARVTRVERQSLNDRLKASINDEVAQEKIDEVEAALPRIEREEVDLNGTNPAQAFLGAGMASTLSYLAWRFTTFSISAYSRAAPVDSDFYIANRLSGVMKQVVVGLGSLATGVFGVIALGLGLLATRVAVGVARGELSMDGAADEALNAAPEPVRDITDVAEALRRAREGGDK